MRQINCILLSLRAELGHEPAFAIGKKFEVFAVRPSLFFDGFMEPVVNAFERRGLEGNDVVYVVGGFIDIRVTEHDNDALSSSLDEPALGFEHRDQRSFTSNQ